MTLTKPFPCISDQGLQTWIPDSAVLVLSFMQAYYRLDRKMNVLQEGFRIEAWQAHAALAYYFANQEMFDAELERLDAIKRKSLADATVSSPAENGWSQLYGALPDNESDEEIAAILERMS